MDRDGFIFLHRKLIASRVFQNEGLLKTWIWCLLKAGHQERWVPVKTGSGETEVFLKEGQFIFGRKTAAKELKMKPSTVNDRIQKLKKLENLDTQPDTHFTIVTIVNWDDYQALCKKPTPSPATRQQPGNTNNKVNNLYTSNFKKFWDDYPKKTGKGAAYKAYQNIKGSKPSLMEILSSLEAHKKTDQWQNKQFIPNPATWLNQRRWEDEIEPAGSKNIPSKQKIMVYEVTDGS